LHARGICGDRSLAKRASSAAATYAYAVYPLVPCENELRRGSFCLICLRSSARLPRKLRGARGSPHQRRAIVWPRALGGYGTGGCFADWHVWSWLVGYPGNGRHQDSGLGTTPDGMPCRARTCLGSFVYFGFRFVALVRFGCNDRGARRMDNLCKVNPQND